MDSGTGSTMVSAKTQKIEMKFNRLVGQRGNKSQCIRHKNHMKYVLYLFIYGQVLKVKSSTVPNTIKGSKNDCILCPPIGPNEHMLTI